MPNKTIAQIYDDLAPRYAEGAGVNEFLTTPLVLHFCPLAAKSALEVCCGVGRNAIELARRVESVWGIDLSHEMMVAARCLAKGLASPPQFIEGDLLTYDFGGRTFDYIYGTYFATYFDPDALLRKLISLTHPASRIFIFDGLQGPGIGTFRFTDIFRQFQGYVCFMHRHNVPADYAGWFTYRWRRHGLLMSRDWKRVEQWKRERKTSGSTAAWGDRMRELLPDAKIDFITSRLACAIWDRN